MFLKASDHLPAKPAKALLLVLQVSPLRMKYPSRAHPTPPLRKRLNISLICLLFSSKEWIDVKFGSGPSCSLNCLRSDPVFFLQKLDSPVHIFRIRQATPTIVVDMSCGKGVRKFSGLDLI